MINTACKYHVQLIQIRAKSKHAQNLRFDAIMESLSMMIMSNLPSSMHKDYGPSFDLNTFHYMHTSEADLAHAQGTVKTARTSL